MMDRESATQAVRAAMAPMTDAMRVMQPFSINGRTWGAPELVPLLVVDPGNIDVHIAQCPAWIAFWGVLSADAKRTHNAKESAYRVARDTWAMKRRAESKVTKDALDEEWRTLPDYQRWYAEQAESERAWSCAQFLYEAFQRKANMLTALARMYADERAAQAGKMPARL